MNYRLKNLLLFPMNILYRISPKLELKILFFLKQGYRLNLKNPKTYNEKLNWQKIFYHNAEMSLCSDKYLVRDYLKRRGCSEYLNDLLWSGYDPNCIPYDKLPNQFVIKVTHGSGFNIICKNKEQINKKLIKKRLTSWLKTKYIKCYGECWYNRERPRIIVEKYLENNDSKPLFDYKFFCFDGKPTYVYVDTWKDGKHHINMYDVKLTRLDNVSLGYPTDFDTLVEKPPNYDEMLLLAHKLSTGFPHVRVDMYNVNNKIVFGEMTFSKGAGFDKILPFDFDLEMGSFFKLEEKNDF